jgi:hypothetical protein
MFRGDVLNSAYPTPKKAFGEIFGYMDDKYKIETNINESMHSETNLLN